MLIKRLTSDVEVSRVKSHVNVMDRHGCTPLHLSAYEGCLEVVLVLLDKGAQVQWRARACAPASSFSFTLANAGR